MSHLPEHLKTDFYFGSSTVHLLTSDLLSMPEEYHPDALVIAEDNYLTMQRSVSKVLRDRLGPEYIQRAQESSPVKAGTLLITDLRNISGGLELAKYVLHATVMDYDFGEKSLDELVSTSTYAALEKAEELGVSSIAFQALGTGSNGLTMSACARSICSSIKTYLAQERTVKTVMIVLHCPSPEMSDFEVESCETRLLDFTREANAILDSPYDPQLRIRQARDFFARKGELGQLEALLKGELPGKRHMILMGGTGMGKWMLLDQLYYLSQTNRKDISEGRFFARVGFVPFLPQKDQAFLLRKLLVAMIRHENDQDRRTALRSVYADPMLDQDRFLSLLNEYPGCYDEVVFLCDGLPQGIELEEGAKSNEASVLSDDFLGFFKAMNGIQDRVRYLISIDDDIAFNSIYPQLQDHIPEFINQTDKLWIRCVSDHERTDWVKSIYQRYLSTDSDAPLEMYRFVEEQAGLNPYLISLACYLMLSRMKRVTLNSPDIIEKGWDRSIIRGIAEAARKLIEKPRSEFNKSLLSILPRQEAVDLFNLSRAVMLEEQTRLLGPALAAGDPNAQSRLAELMVQGNPRELLHRESLEWLFNFGYIYRDSQGKEMLSNPTLATQTMEKLGGFKRPEDIPADVTISLLYHQHTRRSSRNERASIRTLFNTRGGKVVAAEKPLSGDLRKAFMDGFTNFLLKRRKMDLIKGTKEVFRNVEEIGNFMLSQFATLAVKRYLENPPDGCSINFLIDDALKDIPWELMLEATYAGEIPYQVGRSIVSNQAAANIRPPVRGPSSIKALLIGNPTGDLNATENEINWLVSSFTNSPRFAEPDILIGRDACQRIHILNALSSGRYGLVHYSGHSIYSGSQSAWLLSDGEVTTDQLTSAAQAAPPAVLFSSSCFSGSGGESSVAEYENQAFDLPGAFLAAGVEAYIGTLWDVESEAARKLVEKFYTFFLTGDYSLGECLRRARQSLKLEQERSGGIDWLAFILYGDPRLKPADIFPAFR